VVDFINEVEEELRKDEYNRLLKRYGPYLLAIILVIVAGTGFLEYQKYAKDKAARATSASYVSAANLAADGNADQAYREFIAISEKAPAGYSGLSLVRAATLKLEQGQRAEAVNLLDRAAQTFTQPRHIQLAQLKAAYILASDGAYSDVINRLGPLVAKDAPYEYLSRELLGYAALQSKNERLAREHFGYLEAIPGVPPTIRDRAKQNLSMMRTQAAIAAPATNDNSVENGTETENEN